MRPSLVTHARRALEELGLEGATVLVAVSGGPDSMALLSALARLAPHHHLSLAAHGVDHGLRREAATELDLAAAHAATLGVPFTRSQVRVPLGGNLQARARAARWEALAIAARGANAVVATGHHADDRAETVLMRLLRGAGLRGVAAMPLRARAPGAEDIAVVRPLLRARRSDVLAHLERHRVPFARDPSNDDARYLRTRVRKNLLPLLTLLDPRVVEHLVALADEAGAENRGQDAWPAGLPRATQEAIAALVRSGNREARVWLPGGLVVMLAPERSSPGAEESAKSSTPLLVPPRRST